MDIQLSISLLASDRAELLGKCLESIEPLLRELSSELIIVTTGKDSAVAELAGRYTSHIIPFEWCDDFSKARNAGLEKASGEWFLYLDDDEWFEDTSEIIEFFKSGEYRKYQAATYVQRNYCDADGTEYVDAPVGRMCRLTPETRFKYQIHEVLDPFPDPQKRLHSYVHHYGYVGKERQKAGRNIPLLLKRLEEEPTAHTCMQLAQEYWNQEENESALEYCRRGLSLAEKEKRIHTYELWLQVHLPTILTALGKNEEALREGEKLLYSPRILEVGEAHVHAILAEVCWELKEFKRGLSHVREYHKKIQYLENHPEKAELQIGGNITFDTAKDHAVTVYVAGLLFAAAQNERKQIREILTWLPWEEERKISRQYGNLESWKWGNPGLEDVILEGYSLLETDNSYVKLQKALYAEKQGTAEETEKLFGICAGDCPDGFMYQLVELAERNGFSLNPLFGQNLIEEWDECSQMLAERTAEENMENRLQKIRALSEDYPLCAGRLEQHFIEKRLLSGACEAGQMVELLQRYCRSVRAEADMLYKEEIASDPDYYALPYQTRFGLLVEEALRHLEAGNYGACIPFLKKAVNAWPQMSPVVSRLSEYLEEKMTAPQQPVSDEFAILGNQVKQMLLGLMESGQWQAAYGVAQQLTALLPNDLEVLRLKQEITAHL